jgi:RNA polymerase sigma factor (sigma-70 family)
MGGGLHNVIHHLRRAALPDGGAAPDADLLARFAATRDEAAFALLVRRHGPMVLGVCRRVLGGGPDAEDAFQATFLVLARKAAGVAGPGRSAGGWLHRVALRAALRLKASRRGRESPLGDLQPPSPCADPLEEAAGREARAILDEEVSRLPAEFREAFVLFCLGGRATAEVARELNCAVGTVESRVARARQQLRVALARRGVSVPPGRSSEEPRPAAVGPALAASTVQAAIAEGLLGGVIMAKLNGAMALAAAACLLGLGVAWVGLVLPGPHAAARAPLPPAKRPAMRTDAQTILGEWRVVRGDAEGKHLPDEVIAGQVWAFGRSEITVTLPGGESRKMGYTIDPSAAPKGIDLTFDRRPVSGTVPGIYYLKGDTLRVRYSRSSRGRPVAFESSGEERGTVLLEFEPLKPAADLGRGRVRVSQEPNDGKAEGLFALAGPGPAGATLPELYRLAAKGEVPAGAAVLVGRLPGARSVADTMEVASFVRRGTRIEVELKHVFNPEQHHVNKAFFVRVDLPPLPPGRYDVTARVWSHAREGEAVDPVPQRRLEFTPIACTLTVPAAAKP